MHQYNQQIHPYQHMTNNHNSRHRMSYLIKSLAPSSNFEARVQARNDHGWNKLSSTFHFSTRAEGKITFLLVESYHFECIKHHMQKNTYSIETQKTAVCHIEKKNNSRKVIYSVPKLFSMHDNNIRSQRQNLFAQTENYEQNFYSIQSMYVMNKYPEHFDILRSQNNIVN